MQSFKICPPESPSCANSLGVTSYSTDDHSLSNYLKMKTNIEGFTIDEQYEAKYFIDSKESIEELRKVQEELSRLKNEEERKNRKIVNKFLRSK